tara:strand:+ start:2765 stop:3118 length:354 start_codon:yes stop_codon:yes gene_type:complete
MIEIDDRVVMLLFILFLGYMLFNTREGFNVGGQEGMDYNGKCECNSSGVSPIEFTNCVAKQDDLCPYKNKYDCERNENSRCKWTSLWDKLKVLEEKINLAIKYSHINCKHLRPSVCK